MHGTQFLLKRVSKIFQILLKRKFLSILYFKATCSSSFIHSDFLYKNFNAVCPDYFIIRWDLFRFFFATFFQKQASKDHLTQGNLLKTKLLNEKQSNLEKEIYGNISLYSQYFSPGAGSHVLCPQNILFILKTNEKVFSFIFLDEKSSI